MILMYIEIQKKQETSEFKKILQSHGLSQHVKEATHCTIRSFTKRFHPMDTTLTLIYHSSTNLNSFDTSWLHVCRMQILLIVPKYSTKIPLSKLILNIFMNPAGLFPDRFHLIDNTGINIPLFSSPLHDYYTDWSFGMEIS